MKLIILIVLLLSFVTSNDVKGPLIINLNATAQQADISPQGSTIMTCSNGGDGIQIFRNNQSGFELEYTFPGSSFCYNSVMVGEGDLVVYNIGTDLFIQKRNNNTYDLFQSITLSAVVMSIHQSKNGEEIVLASPLGVGNYFRRNASGLYELIQTFNEPSTAVESIFIHESNELVALGSFDKNVYIYRKVGSLYSINQTLFVGFDVFHVELIKETLIVTGLTNSIVFYKDNGSQYIFDHTIPTSEVRIMKMQVSEDLKKLAYGGTNQTFNLFEVVNGSYQSSFSYNIGSTIQSTKITQKDLSYYLVSANSNLQLFYECPDQCSVCSFPNNCSACVDGYDLEGTECIQNPENEVSHCVKNKFQTKDICQEYCSKKCKTCNQTKNDCVECADFYTKNKKGSCVLKHGAFELVTKVRPFFNFIRRKGIKSMFLAVDDLWLYQYHQQEYDGNTKVVLETIRFIEQKQWEITGLEPTKDKVENSLDKVTGVVEYNRFSNPTYLRKERKNNLFVKSTMDYFSFFVPATFVIVFLFNRIFYCLFNYEISKYLRPYAFNWILFEMLVQNNVEYFTFLGFRSFITPFSFNFPTKNLLILGILMSFLTMLGAFSSYFIYYTEYGKLARYFLVNLLRFKSSYTLMVIMYGVRPFVKGAIHALLYDYWVLQIWLLTGTEIIIMIIVCTFEFRNDNHKSKPFFMMDMSYYGCLIILNILLLCKYEYFKDDAVMKELLEEIITVVIYTMLILLILKIIWEYIPWDWLKKSLCSSQEPEAENSSSEPKKENQKKPQDEMNENGENKREVCKVEKYNIEDLMNEFEQTGALKSIYQNKETEAEMIQNDQYDRVKEDFKEEAKKQIKRKKKRIKKEKEQRKRKKGKERKERKERQKNKEMQMIRDIL